jgi:hypothetical protein
MAGAFSMVNAKSERIACIRVVKSVMAGYSTNSAGWGSHWRSGSARAGTWNRCSP